MKIGILGAGKAACRVVEHAMEIDGMDIMMIADINRNAPAAHLAKKLDIPFISDYHQMLGNRNIELIIELTGVPKIRDDVFANKASFQEIMPAQAARLYCQSLEAQHQKDQATLNEFTGFVGEIADSIGQTNNSVEDSIKQIYHIVRNIRMININAKIEASRLGQQGLSFDAIINELVRLANSIENTLSAIETARDGSTSALHRLKNKDWLKKAA